MSEHSYPVSKWAIGIFYVLAFVFFCYRDWHAIDASASSTAAIAYIYVPFWAAIAALPFAGVGYAAGAVIRAWQTRQRRHVIIASMGAILTVSYFAYVVSEQVTERELATTITRIENLDATGLATFLDDDKYRTNQYALAAVAMNPAASSVTLARISAIDDVALHKKFGGPRELMGRNRKGLAVLRLVSRNVNVSPETLTVLSHSPDTYVLGDVAMNKATPKAIIERLYLERNRKSDGYLIEWGLAYNRATPEIILRELAENSRNEYTLRGIGTNPSAPDDVKDLVKERIASGAYKHN